jgi:predicted small lipoprotein YifL
MRSGRLLLFAGAVAVAALLAGCGRKGPLELPPAAQNGASAGEAKPRTPPAMDREGYPVAPPGEKKPIGLDWLID